MKYRPCTEPVEAFQFKHGVKHPVLTYNEAVEGVGGPDYGGDYDVLIGHQGQTQTVRERDYVIVKADGLCKVMKAELFEAIYEVEP